ncbi:hypothetical protein ACOMCU_00545 [Lysinibacillus sp. UGB7]|uniref:hypothetical protein n=1 Tax=Lysinibacillus sp. UGB7 TaxID=3411039 RepID=UPI003B7BE0CA
MRVKIKKSVSVDKDELAALEFGKRYCASILACSSWSEFVFTRKNTIQLLDIRATVQDGVITHYIGSSCKISKAELKRYIREGAFEYIVEIDSNESLRERNRKMKERS